MKRRIEGADRAKRGGQLDDPFQKGSDAACTAQCAYATFVAVQTRAGGKEDKPRLTPTPPGYAAFLSRTRADESFDCGISGLLIIL